MIMAASKLLFFSVVTLALLSSAAVKPRRLVTRLIHRDSIFSPYYKPNETISDRVKREIKTSFARLAYLKAKTNMNFIPQDTRAGVIVEETGAQFMANFSIGEPPIPQLLTMDTGSSLLWIQCLPCIRCFNQSSSLFNPSKSSTYANISCTSPDCNVSPSEKCDPSNNCKFSQEYVDGTTAKGVLATEKLTFETSDEGITSLSGMIFGCANDNNGYNGQPSGVLGLGPESLSISSKLGSKFSYCIGNINDPKYTHNQLILGDGAIIQGDSTPIEIFKDLYYLNLESISVGQKTLQIDPQTFKRTPSGNGGVVIDSGTTITLLAEGAHTPLRNEVQSLLDQKLQRVTDPDDPTKLCYRGEVSRDLTGFPVVTMEFSGGAELGLDVGSMFERNGEGEFCMAVHVSGLKELSVIGIVAQQSYNIGFDVGGRNIYFQRIDCQLLDS